MGFLSDKLVYIPSPLLKRVAFLSDMSGQTLLRKSSQVTAAREFNMEDTELKSTEIVMMIENSQIYNIVQIRGWLSLCPEGCNDLCVGRNQEPFDRYPNKLMGVIKINLSVV